MTAMDILEALGQTEEELLHSCEESMNGECGGAGSSGAEEDEENQVRRKRRVHRLFFLKTAGNQHMAAGMIAAAVLLLACAAGGGYIRRSFSAGNRSSTSAINTQESAEITADTAEEETVVEEAGAASTESAMETEESAVSGEASDKEILEEETVAEYSTLPALQLAEVSVPGVDTTALSEEEYGKLTELVQSVQEEIDAALSAESMETLPVFWFIEQDADLIENLGDYPVITQEEAEELLWQGYYLSSAGFSAEDADSGEAVSVELCYLVSAETLIYMPYYLFTVVIEEDMVYTCCVPAVSREYLMGTLSCGTVE
ncbi:MAG: hypothetical protein LUH58_09795 [Lachnospiraceae bacterium]|nr:hypothetical protein [Lachnospiraceae bacterium]